MRSSRFWAVALLPAVALLGLACKTYRGPAHPLINHYGPASVCYVLFWMLLAFVFFNQRRHVLPITWIVGIATCCIEFLQLYHPSWLEWLRTTLPGKYILGTTFTWWDFPAYFVGAIVGYGVLHWISATCDNHTESQ